MRFEFATATRIVFGPGSLRFVGFHAWKIGARALVVTGSTPKRAEFLLSLLIEQGITPTVFPVAGEPDIKVIEQGVATAKEARTELVIAFGGGSALDTGKAIAAMLANDGELMDYLEVVGRGKTLAKLSVPFIAIPTTAGTGSEVTRNAVIASPQHRAKVSLRSPHMLPTIALVDPDLARDLPPHITASTGLDALTQLIEPFVSSRANPMTDALCVEGIRHAARSLRTAFNDGNNRAAREDMALASLFGGLALANAGLGAVHGLAGPIGGMFPAPHGEICAALLPQIMETNFHALQEREPNNPALRRYEEIARILTGNHEANALDGIEWVRKLVADLKIPPLRKHGITSGDIPEIIARASKASSMKANPLPLTDAELADALTRAM